MSAPQHVDFVVIGAGISGAAVALALAKRQAAVLCIAPGSQSATNAAGAMLGVLGEVTHDDPIGEIALSLRLDAQKRYSRWLEEIGELTAETPGVEQGSFVIASARRSEDVSNLRAIEDAAGRCSLPCERVDADDIPGLRHAADHCPAAALALPNEGWVNAPHVRRAALRAAEATGHARMLNDRVARLVIGDGRLVGVETAAHGLIACRTAVICAGADTNPLLASHPDVREATPEVLGAKGVAVILRRHAFCTHDQPTATLRTPNREFACGIHVVPRRDGSVYVGATNRVSRLLDASGDATAAEVAALIHDVTSELATYLRDWNVVQVLHGLRPLAEDGLPIAGPTAIPGLSVLSGGYRNGVLLAPLLADLVCLQIDGGSATGLLTGIDVALLAPRRRRLEPAPLQLAIFCRDLARMVQDPTRPDWHDRLEPLLLTLTQMVLAPDEHRELQSAFAHRLSESPIPEIVPEAIVELLQNAAREPGRGVQPATQRRRSNRQHS